MRKTKAQLQAELDAANKRCADLADALVKTIQAQPVYYPYPYLVPAAAPQWPMYPTFAIGTPDIIVGQGDYLSIGNGTACGITVPSLTVKVQS